MKLPTYEYACTGCGYQFEVVHSAKETPAISCASCGGTTRKVFFPARVIFKGSGWHITDYGRHGEKNANGKSSDTNAEAKSEEKAAAS